MVQSYSPCSPATDASNKEDFDKPQENLKEKHGTEPPEETS